MEPEAQNWRVGYIKAMALPSRLSRFKTDFEQRLCSDAIWRRGGRIEPQIDIFNVANSNSILVMTKRVGQRGGTRRGDAAIAAVRREHDF